MSELEGIPPINPANSAVWAWLGVNRDRLDLKSILILQTAIQASDGVLNALEAKVADLEQRLAVATTRADSLQIQDAERIRDRDAAREVADRLAGVLQRWGDGWMVGSEWGEALAQHAALTGYARLE